MKDNFQLPLRTMTLSRRKECYESKILKRLDDVGMTYKHVSNETLELSF